ncbi:MAG: hypothetical protein GF333_02780 [Candidatus Omnitrophica bacterium]|nr:hypothetical protein [Candidatus Omnitrophota bacterium]
MKLKDEIRKLVQLQEFDEQIFRLKEEKEQHIPAQIAALKHQFEERKESLSYWENALKEEQVQKKNKELDLAAKEEAVQKAQAQLYQLKTNKEYQAKLTEIASLKADASLIEEEILKVLEKVEEAERQRAEEKQKLEQEEKKFQQSEQELKNRGKDIDARISGLSGKREELAKDIDKKLLSRYERLLSVGQGRALAPIQGDSCGACYMRVTHQTINEVRMYKDPISCESCMRILYIPDDMEQ